MHCLGKYLKQCAKKPSFIAAAMLLWLRNSPETGYNQIPFKSVFFVSSQEPLICLPLR